jgi:DNA processing protein
VISPFDVLTLSQIPNIGAYRLRTLISHFGETNNIFSATANEFAYVEGFTRKVAISASHFLRSDALTRAQRFAEEQLGRAGRAGCRVVSYWDDVYPEQLKRIYDPPAFYFMLGELLKQDSSAIAIVGTRMPSDYGTVVAEKFGQEFARLGITVVSGLARGVDTVAHSAALRSGGRTIAVIGSGIDVIYPPENKGLSARIATSGAVLSEYSMSAKPDAVNFPKRNRIISGLSLGTLVIETDINGGAMITAAMALDQNREVFAVPAGILARRGRGCNTLIRDGKAKLVESIEDITAELAQKLAPPVTRGATSTLAQPQELSLFEKHIYDVCSETPLHIDLLAERVQLAMPDVLVNLLSLEFKGLVKQLPGKVFVRI